MTACFSMLRYVRLFVALCFLVCVFTPGCLTFCVCVWMSSHLLIYVCVWMSSHLLIYAYVWMSSHLLIYVCVWMSSHLLIYVCVWMSSHLLIYVCVRTSSHQSVDLNLCLNVPLPVFHLTSSAMLSLQVVEERGILKISKLRSGIFGICSREMVYLDPKTAEVIPSPSHSPEYSTGG